MPKASEVAAELNKLADALMREPDQELPKADISFYCKYLGDKGKPMFLSLARILPHPLTKAVQKYCDDGMEIAYASAAASIVATIERSQVCKLVKAAQTIPAEYDCDPLLSAEEENSLEVSR